jgi:flavin reductase (DIM6/NTAB) family NADH-FMN oxidoreductase RutF
MPAETPPPPPPSAPGVSAEEFRRALSRWASGVSVFTAAGPRGPVGLTVSSFASLSLEPPLVLGCIARSSSSHGALVDAPGFAVHLLGDDQEHLSDRFARSSSDKFDGLAYGVGPYGAPLLPLGLARLVCAREAVCEGGDHTILIGRVVAAETTPEGWPLVYYARAYRRLSDAT